MLQNGNDFISPALHLYYIGQWDGNIILAGVLPSVGFAASAMVSCMLVSQVVNIETIDSRCDNGELHFNPWMTK